MAEEGQEDSLLLKASGLSIPSNMFLANKSGTDVELSFEISGMRDDVENLKKQSAEKSEDMESVLSLQPEMLVLENLP